MITTSYLWLDISLGLLAGGLVLGALLALTVWDGLRQERAARELHVPQHRALAPAPVEVIRLPEGRTEEQPIAHVGASVDWSPTAELALVPARPLDPAEAERVDEERELHDELDRVLAPILDQLARVGHEDSHTCEWTREEISALLDRAGAR